MRTVLIIALMAIHLFGNTELSGLLKLPKLVSHYLEHKRLNPSLIFGDFLSMHSGGDDGTSADDDTDDQLPYHTDHHCLFNTYYLPDQFNLPLKQGEPVSDYHDRMILDNLSKHVSLILEPPRIA